MLHHATLAFDPDTQEALTGRPTLARGSFAACLVDLGLVDVPTARKATELALQTGRTIGDVLLARGDLTAGDLARAAARHGGHGRADPLADPPDPRLIARLGVQDCLRRRVLPWRRHGGVTWVLCAEPVLFDRAANDLRALFGEVTPLIAPQADIDQAIADTARTTLRDTAATRVDEIWSARAWPGLMRRLRLPWTLGALGLTAVLVPHLALAVMVLWLVLSLGATTLLRGFALINPQARRPTRLPLPVRLPVISILVPMFNEPGIAARLVRRIGRLDYPRDCLDVLLVLEEDDHATKAALIAAGLPPWMRLIVVPDGTPRTKPRAMNYALDFCRGEIVGIYDAEDAPDPGQLKQVAAHFAQAGPDVACLQGVLDYYNPQTNWLARCFTVEYAAWFRMVMPALQRLRVPMPLGGTTLFLRRDVIDRIGGWDAHNVTEDADLGVRLARCGWRVEMLASTTEEEANCRLRPWLRQRSRWIKGHLLTWAIHMRNPARLWRDLGPRGFIGYQVVFLGAQSQVLLAPFMWSFWLAFAGLPHPVAMALPMPALYALFGLFLLAEGLSISLGVMGARRTRHRHLAGWAPSLHFYHPLGAIAGWRAVWESLFDPFSWAKTSHGHFDTVGVPVPIPEPGQMDGARPAPTQRVAGRVILFRRAELAQHRPGPSQQPSAPPKAMAKKRAARR